MLETNILNSRLSLYRNRRDCRNEVDISVCRVISSWDTWYISVVNLNIQKYKMPIT